MKEHFAIWLHGFFELTNANSITPEQVKVIKKKLDECFNKVMPQRYTPLLGPPYDDPQEGDLAEGAEPELIPFFYTLPDNITKFPA
jgi:hypothetical protein